MLQWLFVRKTAKVRTATGPEFGNALHDRIKCFGELIAFCNALHYRINCFEN